MPAQAVAKCLRWSCASDPKMASQCVAEERVHNNCADKAYEQIVAFKKLKPQNKEAYQQALFTNKFFAFLGAMLPQDINKMEVAFAKEKNKKPLTNAERQFLLGLVKVEPLGDEWVTIDGQDVTTLTPENAYFLAHQQKINFANISLKRLTKALREASALTDLRVSFFKGAEGTWFKQEQLNLKKLQDVLKNQTHLKTVEIDAQNLTPTRLQGILQTIAEVNPNLEALTLSHVTVDQATDSQTLTSIFAVFKHLKKVGLRYVDGPLSVAFFLKIAPTLRKIPVLDLTGSNLGTRVTMVPVLNALSEVGGTPSGVRDLTVSYINLDRDELLALRNFHLTHLTMATYPEKEKRHTLDLEALLKLFKSERALTHIALSGFILSTNHTKVQQVMEAISKLPQLRVLSLTNMKLIDQDIEPLAQLKGPVDLNLEGNEIGRAGVRNVILKLHTLKRVNLANNPNLSRYGILELGNKEALPNLKWLSFSNVGVSLQQQQELRRPQIINGKSADQVTLVILAQGAQ